MASNTGARSPGDELMTCTTSAVAVCRSFASFNSRVRSAMDGAAFDTMRALGLFARRPFTGCSLPPRCRISLPSGWGTTRLNLMQILSFAPRQFSIWLLVRHVRFTSATWPADIRYEQTVAVARHKRAHRQHRTPLTSAGRVVVQKPRTKADTRL